MVVCIVTFPRLESAGRHRTARDAIRLLESALTRGRTDHASNFPCDREL